MINDEAVRVVAATLRHTDWDDDNPGHREEMATEIVRALSRLEQSRVERALSTCERLLKAWHHNEHVVCCVEQVRDALLTTPIDSSAGSPEKSDPDVRTVASGESGGRSSPLTGPVEHAKFFPEALSVEQAEARIKMLTDDEPPPAEVKPSRLRTAQAALENLPDGDPSDDEIRGIRIALWQLYYYLDEQHARGRK